MTPAVIIVLTPAVSICRTFIVIPSVVFQGSEVRRRWTMRPVLWSASAAAILCMSAWIYVVVGPASFFLVSGVGARNGVSEASFDPVALLRAGCEPAGGARARVSKKDRPIPDGLAMPESGTSRNSGSPSHQRIQHRAGRIRVARGFPESVAALACVGDPVTRDRVDAGGTQVRTTSRAAGSGWFRLCCYRVFPAGQCRV